MKSIDLNDLNYPTEYYQFGGYGKCSDGEINSFIAECVNSIREKYKQEPERPSYFSTVSTGDSIVVVYAYQYERNRYTVKVIVAKNYWDGSVHDVML